MDENLVDALTATGRDVLIDDGLHLLCGGVGLFLEKHPEWASERKAAFLAGLSDLEKDLVELVRERDGEESAAHILKAICLNDLLSRAQQGEQHE